MNEKLTAPAECTPCVAPTSSMAGSDSCLECQENFYLVPSPELGWSPRQRCLPCPSGASCVRAPLHYEVDGFLDDDAFFNADDIRLKWSRWRLSPHSPVISQCKTSADMSSTPCIGGSSAGHDGQGYCAVGHYGPLCELCNQTTVAGGKARFFSEDAAHCIDCPVLKEQAIYLASIGGGLLLIVGATVIFLYKLRPHDNWRALVVYGRRIVLLAQSHAFIPKLKILVSVYQTIAAIPTVYNVQLSPWYHEQMQVLDWFSIHWDSLVVPGSCLQIGEWSSFYARLLVRGVAPFILVFLVGVAKLSAPYLLKLLAPMVRRVSTTSVPHFERLSSSDSPKLRYVAETAGAWARRGSTFGLPPKKNPRRRTLPSLMDQKEPTERRLTARIAELTPLVSTFGSEPAPLAALLKGVCSNLWQL